MPPRSYPQPADSSDSHMPFSSSHLKKASYRAKTEEEVHWWLDLRLMKIPVVIMPCYTFSAKKSSPKDLFPSIPLISFPSWNWRPRPCSIGPPLKGVIEWIRDIGIAVSVCVTSSGYRNEQILFGHFVQY